MGTESLETDGKSMDDAKKTKEELIEQVRALRLHLKELEHSQAADKLILAKADWEKTFGAVPDPIAIIDRDHRIVRINKAMAEKLSVTAEEVAGTACYECVHGTKEPPEFCPHSKLLVDGQEHVAEVSEERLDYVGGSVDIQSQPDNGSRFVLSAPLKTETDLPKEKSDGNKNSTG